MKLTELQNIVDNYDEGDFTIEPAELKNVVARIGTIDWSEFLTLQTINIYKPSILYNTKFLNFSEVADPTSSANKPILLECLSISHQLSTNSFTSFSSQDVCWGYCHFLLAYLQDVVANISKDDIIEIRQIHDEIHDEII